MEKFKLSAIWRYEKQTLKHATLNQETFFMVLLLYLQVKALLWSQSHPSIIQVVLMFNMNMKATMSKDRAGLVKEWGKKKYIYSHLEISSLNNRVFRPVTMGNLDLGAEAAFSAIRSKNAQVIPFQSPLPQNE